MLILLFLMKFYIYIEYKKLLLDLQNKTMKILAKFGKKFWKKKEKFLEKSNTHSKID